jgi:hypothetical protein
MGNTLRLRKKHNAPEYKTYKQWFARKVPEVCKKNERKLLSD